VFTPEPYITANPLDGSPSKAVVVDERGLPTYSADLVKVTIERDAREDFLDWLDSSPFSLMRPLGEGPRPEYLIGYVRVPAGSVSDALRFIEGRPGVLSVEKSYFRIGL
jgi:hypothetical protein